MNKLLTIVVPVYKVEAYINKCLDSLLVNPILMNKLEVIIINDGTPDNSAEMSREFVKRYPDTFRQIDKDNGGHGSAWNVGLKEATGKYIRFLDSDDWLTNLPEFLEKLQDCDADVVITRLSRYYEDKGYSVNTQCPRTIDRVLPISNIGPEEFEEYSLVTNFWFSTYKADILKPLCPLFLEGISYDDGILFLIPLLFAKNYIAYDLILYNYLLGREGQSMALDIQVKKIPDRFKVLHQMCSFLNKTALQENNSWLVEEIISFRRNILLGLFSSVKPYRLSSSYNSEFKSFKGIKEFKPQSKMYKRYKKYPYFIFYMIERIRNLSLRRKIIEKYV